MNNDDNTTTAPFTALLTSPEPFASDVLREALTNELDRLTLRFRLTGRENLANASRRRALRDFLNMR